MQSHQITCLPSQLQADGTFLTLSSARSDTPLPLLADSISLSSASSDSLPRNHDLDILDTEAAQMRALRAERDAVVR